MTGRRNGRSTRLLHGRTQLHLECLADRAGPNLLLLHSLFGSLEDWRPAVRGWEGSVWALDFAGHGRSTWREGGLYFPEAFAADADAALRELGEAYVAGSGVGAYVALLIAGARPERVPAALLLDGPGLWGGGPNPPATPDKSAFERLYSASVSSSAVESVTTDPRVVLAEDDVRPEDYAVAFAREANLVLLAEDESPRPPWWMALRAEGRVRALQADRPELLRQLGESTRPGARQT